MDSTLKKTLLSHLLNSDSDEEFIETVNALSNEEGETVFKGTFEMLSGVIIPEEEATHHWQALLSHRETMIGKLDRTIDLTTVLSDYLQQTTTFLERPRLVETVIYENVVHEKIHDQLTGLFNRHYFDESFQQQIYLGKRYKNLFSILFLDIDNFKTVNDTYGHLAGDEALRQVSAIILEEKRDSDIAARYGGEEFVVLMPNTDNISSFVLAERIRKKVENLTISYKDFSFNLTISGGLASFPFNTEDPDQLLQMADSALYLSKGAGKNRTSHYKEEKRRYLRVKIDQPVLAKELDFSKSQTFNGISKNICVGGILFENPKPLPLGSLIKVKVPVSESSPLILIGTVVRIEAYEKGRYDIGMTTSFKEMDKLVIEEISDIVQNGKISM